MAAVDGHGAPPKVRNVQLQEARQKRCAAPGQRINAKRRCAARSASRIASPARASAACVMRRFRPGAAASRADPRDVDELRERRSGSGRFQRAPVDIVAEIAAGIARQRGSVHARARGARAGARTAAWPPDARLAGHDGPLVRPVADDIGEQDRHRIARARLDAHKRRAAPRARTSARCRACASSCSFGRSRSTAA